MNKIFPLVLNLVLMLLGLILLGIVSAFWLGTIEAYHYQMTINKIDFLLGRFLLNSVCSSLIICLISIILYGYSYCTSTHVNLKKIIFIDAAILCIGAILGIAFFHL